MENKQKKGISLIVLVITIIVMIILAAAIILSLNGSGIIGKANQAKTDSDKANMLESANMLVAEYELKVNTGEEVEDKLSDYVKDNLIAQGFKEAEIDKLLIDDDKRTVEYIEPIIHNGIIPEGGIYHVGATKEPYWSDDEELVIVQVGDYSLATSTYNAGDKFPETVNNGDVYVYGNYEYRYNYIEYGGYDFGNINGWSVRVRDTSNTKYGEILSEINGKPITSLDSTFRGCTSLTAAPVIPKSVTRMVNTFADCVSLTTAPIIPESVINMSYAFQSCYSLKKAPAIPKNVTSMVECFGNCSNLTTAPIIPESVTDIERTFAFCRSLTGVIEINSSNLTSYSECFFETRQLIKLTGACQQLEDIAAEYDNVTVKE